MKDLLSRLSLIRLHHAILIALGLGIFFGAYLSVSKYRLEITYVENNQEQTYVIENGLNLHLSDQLTILLTAMLASIGTASVPGIGIVMLMIVLRSVHIPAEGIALILGVDRILDMCRTTVNITGDAAVAVVVANSEGMLSEEKKGK